MGLREILTGRNKAPEAGTRMQQAMTRMTGLKSKFGLGNVASKVFQEGESFVVLEFEIVPPAPTLGHRTQPAIVVNKGIRLNLSDPKQETMDFRARSGWHSLEHYTGQDDKKRAKIQEFLKINRSFEEQAKFAMELSRNSLR